MKIKRHTNINATNFEYLSEGTVFKFLKEKEEDNSLYMRIKRIGTINAIDLESGESFYFTDCATVVVVDGEFVTNE